MTGSRGPSARSHRRTRAALPTWVTGTGATVEDDGGVTVEVRPIQPFQATKAYTCPGCNGTIAAGTGHLVVVPQAAPEDRRHWHRSCWERRHRRRSGR